MIGSQIRRDEWAENVDPGRASQPGALVSGPTLHVLRLDTIGGVERSFTAFLAHADSGDHNHVIVVGRPIHNQLRGRVQAAAQSVSSLRTWCGLRVPKGLRGRRWSSLIRKVAPRRIVAWNHFADPDLSRCARAAGVPLIYYERGAGWQRPPDDRSRSFLEQTAGCVCNSDAAARVLALRHGWDGPTQVERNCLRSDAKPSAAQHKGPPEGRAWRIGVAGRLVPLKGHVVAIAALAQLRGGGLDAELHVAGSGPEEDHLRTVACGLGIGDQVHFRGMLGDMPAFYREIDLLVVPSLREPFGLVSIEAAAWGCPVVVAAVDGLPETIEPGVTGLSVPCSLPLDAYERLGGRLAGMPELVYDPETDTLREPRCVSPEVLTEAVASLCGNPDRYRRMSQAAGVSIPDAFDFDGHVIRVSAAFSHLAP